MEINREIERLWLSDTHFENPVGFDARSHHMSARPSEGWRSALRRPAFREMVSTEHASIFTPLYP